MEPATAPNRCITTSLGRKWDDAGPRGHLIMTVYRNRQGVRPLLFDRLAAPPQTAGQIDPRSLEHGPSGIVELAGLRASIQRELTDLLNTRSPLAIDVIELRSRSTIDYGLPDLSAFPVGNHDAMHRLEQHIRAAITAYEPRLRDPVVRIDPATIGTDSISVRVSGVLAAGTMRATPVTFALLTGNGVADDDAA